MTLRCTTLSTTTPSYADGATLTVNVDGRNGTSVPCETLALGLTATRARRADDSGIGAERGDHVAAAARREGERVGAGRVREHPAHLDAAEGDDDFLGLSGGVEHAAHGHGVAEDDRPAGEDAGERERARAPATVRLSRSRPPPAKQARRPRSRSAKPRPARATTRRRRERRTRTRRARRSAARAPRPWD